MGRDERLEALKQSVKEWADNRRKTITDAVDSGKRLLNQRGELAHKANRPVEALVIDEIQQFLDGELS